jgi:hypothetical protein
VPECGNAKLFEVLGGEAREDPLVDLVVAECRLVFFEAQAPQPDHHVHDGAHNQWWRASSAGERSVSRAACEVPMVLELHNVRLG